MSWLLSALKPLFNWLLSLGIQKLIQAIKHYIEEKAKAKQREAVLKKAKEDVIKASQQDGLSEEERIQRQKDAFKKLIDTYNALD